MVVGPSIEFKKKMLDPYLQMIEDSAKKVKGPSDKLIQMKDRQRKFNRWYIQPEIEKKYSLRKDIESIVAN